MLKEQGQGMNNSAETALVPMVFVRDIRASTAFYRELGLDIANSVTPQGDYNRGGEFRIIDPAGYVVFVAQI